MNIIGMSNVSFLTKNIQYTTLKLNFKSEDFVYDRACGNNQIVGATIDKETEKEKKYIYIYDCNSNALIKKK